MKSHRAARAGGVAAALLASSLIALPAAEAATSPGSWYFLTNGTTGGSADIAFQYGRPDDTVLVGDWDGDGVDTLGVRRGNMYYLTNGTTGGVADITFAYGRSTDTVLVGDWDGDGKDTLGVRRGASYYLTNRTTGGAADVTFIYGKSTDVVLVGDWNGDAKDTLGVRRGASYFLTNGTTGGAADVTFIYGKSTDVVLVGDWNGDAQDTLGVRRGASYFLTNGTTGGAADVTFIYGKSTDVVLVGDWNGDAQDTLGVRRVAGPGYIPAPNTTDGEDVRWFTVGSYTMSGWPHLPTGLYTTKDSQPGCEWVTQDTAENILGMGMGPGPAYAELTGDVAWFGLTDQCNLSWRTAFPGDPAKLVMPTTGQYRTGYDVAPGLYAVTPVDPDPSDEANTCWVAFLDDFTGKPGSYVGAEVPYGEQAIVEILPEDRGFETLFCNATFTKYTPVDGTKFESVNRDTIGQLGVSSTPERPVGTPEDAGVLESGS